MRRTDLYLTDEQYKHLKRYAEDHGLTLSEVMRSAVDCWLKGQVAVISAEAWCAANHPADWVREVLTKGAVNGAKLAAKVREAKKHKGKKKS